MAMIYLIRHAEAEGNVFRRAHGQYNSLVTKKAQAQIESLRKRFEPIRVDAVYSSDLYRAMATVAPIARDKGLEIIRCRDLREIDMGAWEDMPWGNIPRYDEVGYRKWEHEPWSLTIEKGESTAQVADRMERALRQIGAKTGGGTVVAASHGAAIRAVLCRLMGLPPEKMAEIGWCDNTAVALLETDENGGMKLIYHNDNSHLTEEMSTFSTQEWWRNGPMTQGINMWFERACPERDAGALAEIAADAGLPPTELMEAVSDQAAENPDYAVFFHLRDERTGFVLLCDDKTERDVGEIKVLYLASAYRRTGYLEQLLGHAVCVFRKAGKKAIVVQKDGLLPEIYEFYDCMGFYQSPEDARMLRFSIEVPGVL